MADSLINLLQTRTVLIHAGNAIGTGTLIAPGMVLTCAHVVREAVETSSSIEVLLPSLSEPGLFVWTENAQNVYLSIKYEEQNKAGIDPDTPSARPLTTEYPDVAVIEISKKDHAMISFPKSDEVPEGLRNHQFLAFGFQKKDRDLQRNVPQAVSLNYSGEQVDGIIRKLMFTNGLIRPGMSGAALIDRERGKIVGIVHMTMNPNDDLGAYVIPLEMVWKVFEKWNKEGVNSLFDQLRSKKLKTLIRNQYSREYPEFPLFQKYGIRLIVLPVLIFLALWWIFFHLGAIEDSLWISAVLVAVSIFGKLIGDWLGEGVSTDSGRIRNKVGKVLLSVPFLIIMASFIGLLWTFSSSVWIYGNSTLGEIPITFYKDQTLKEGHQKNLDPTGKARFLVFAFPYEKTAVLVPEGREAKFIGVKSFSRNEFYYPRDFLLEPVVLIRFDPKFLDLMGKYRVHIKIEKPGANKSANRVQFIDSTLANMGSLMIGARKPVITKARELEWKQFFENQSIEMTLLENWVANWKKIKSIPEIDLDIGDSIKLKVVKKRDGSILKEQGFSIKDSLTDALLIFE